MTAVPVPGPPRGAIRTQPTAPAAPPSTAPAAPGRADRRQWSGRRCDLPRGRARLRGQHDRQRGAARFRAVRRHRPLDSRVADCVRRVLRRGRCRWPVSRRVEPAPASVVVHRLRNPDGAGGRCRRCHGRRRAAPGSPVPARPSGPSGHRDGPPERHRPAPGGPDLTTTVLTPTLTGLASESSLAAGSHPRQGRRIAAVVAMVTGAPAGGVLTLQAGLPTALVVTALVFAFVTVGFAVVLRDTDHQASRPRPRVVQPGVPRGGACLLPRP
jgi:hypothetical protein